MKLERVHRGLLTLVGLLISGAMLLPIIWMFITSVRPEMDVVSFPPTLIPRNFTFEHFIDIWGSIPFAQLYLNTIIFAGSVTVISLLLDAMTGYALARLNFRGKSIVFMLIIVLLMVPFQVTLIPLYDLLDAMNLASSLPGMIAPRMTNAFGVFFMRQFYLSLPKDLEEAARIDGASEWKIFISIVNPLAKPALLTLGLFHFQYNWNDLLWPLIMSKDIESATLPAGLSMFVGQHVVEYGLLMAGAVLAMLPVVVFFLIIQKSFVAGIATSGLK